MENMCDWLCVEIDKNSVGSWTCTERRTTAHLTLYAFLIAFKRLLALFLDM